MPEPIRPLYLFSLPRSGSTLVQRLLAAHPQVASAGESCLLLPLLYMRRKRGTFAEYSHAMTSSTIPELVKQLPQGEADYRAAVREMVLRLYGLASHERASYFLDKCPRYDLVADEIIELFPQGRFIFLWRNPLAIAASILNTFGHWPRGLFTNHIDLYKGMDRMVAAYEKHRDRVLAVRYEDLLDEPEPTLARIWDHLELPAHDAALEQLAQIRYKGGDPTGQDQYQSLSHEPLEKWKAALANPIRRRWCRRYLRWLGEHRLSVMGYDMAALQADLDALPFSARHLLRDAWKFPYGAGFEYGKRRLLKS